MWIPFWVIAVFFIIPLVVGLFIAFWKIFIVPIQIAVEDWNNKRKIKSPNPSLK